MGVKDLWPILEPVAIQVPLKDLAGQVIAVDLSGWVVETQGVKQMQGAVVKGYLRNLFFRCSHLMNIGVKLVFVIEGEPPEIKWEAMAKRQVSQGRGGWRGRGRGRGRGAAAGAPVGKKTRSHFKSILRECCEMLDYLGLPYVQSCGEAEGTCARLNALGLVDACMTNDGDAFLYGAKTVYRNFTMDKKDPHVERYEISCIEDTLGLNQDSMIALALLLGCDYVPKGVPGVGKESALKLLTNLPVTCTSILERFREWNNVDFVSTIAHLPPEVRQPEIAVRQKAISTAGFPFEKVIKEFSCTSENKTLKHCRLKWKRPKLFNLQKFHVDKLEWVEEYALEKVLPLVTRYDLDRLRDSTSREDIRHLEPHSIVKQRIRQGQPMYEIQWHKNALDDITPRDYYVTIEDQEVFQQCFPEIVSAFEEQVKPSGKSTRKRQKPQEAIEEEETTSVPVSGPENVCVDNEGPRDAVEDLLDWVGSLSLTNNNNVKQKVKSKSNLSKAHTDNAVGRSSKETVTLSKKSKQKSESTVKFLDIINSDNDSDCEILPLSQRINVITDVSHTLTVRDNNAKSRVKDVKNSTSERQQTYNNSTIRKKSESTSKVDLLTVATMKDKKTDDTSKVGKPQTQEKTLALSFLENDSDSCLLVGSSDDEQDANKENAAVQNNSVTPLHPLYTAHKHRNKFTPIADKKDCNIDMQLANLSLGTPLSAVRNFNRSGIPNYLSPLGDSQLGHFSIDFSLRSEASVNCSAYVENRSHILERSPIIIDVTTPASNNTKKKNYTTSMSSTPLSTPSSACNPKLDDSFEDRPMCLSQRLAKRLGTSEKNLLSSFK